MAMHDKLLEILVCPACKGPLVAQRAQADDAAPADDRAKLLALDCRRCGLRYPVEDDIPVMLVDQARRFSA
jgi:uncharacterized protein YbaR (Trm112 family)